MVVSKFELHSRKLELAFLAKLKYFYLNFVFLQPHECNPLIKLYDDHLRSLAIMNVGFKEVVHYNLWK